MLVLEDGMSLSKEIEPEIYIGLHQQLKDMPKLPPQPCPPPTPLSRGVG